MIATLGAMRWHEFFGSDFRDLHIVSSKRRTSEEVQGEAVEWEEVKEGQVRSGNQEETETETEDGDENEVEIQSDNEGD